MNTEHDPEESPATTQLRRALQMNPDDGVLLSMLALKLLYDQKHQEADQLVERALEVGPEDTQVIRYVRKYLQKQMFTDVLQKLDEELSSICQNICLHYANFCLHHTYEKDRAAVYFKKVLEFSTDTSERRLAAKKLRKIADQRLNRNRRDAEAYGILGYVAKAEGERRMAVRYYEDALDRDRSNEEFLSALWELRLELE